MIDGNWLFIRGLILMVTAVVFGLTVAVAQRYLQEIGNMFRRFFVKKPCVLAVRGGAYVYGKIEDVIRMFAACAMALERDGFDMHEIQEAMGRIKRKDEGKENAK